MHRNGRANRPPPGIDAKNSPLLDISWWRRTPDGDYTQQVGRGQLLRMLDSGGRTASWAIKVDGKYIGECKALRDAKLLAYRLTSPRAARAARANGVFERKSGGREARRG